MMTLLMAAAVAAQATPATNAQAQMAGAEHAQHEAMKKDCCCKYMAEAAHDKHAPEAQHQGHSGQ
jgi:hypothetical protein